MVSIIIVNYNGFNDTCELIESIKTNETYPYEIIIVDNASKNNEGDRLKTLLPDIKVICSKINTGFAQGNNIGVAHRCEESAYLLFLNNDTILTGPILEKMIKPFENNRKIGCVSPKVTFWPEKETLQYAGATPMSAITLRNEFIGYNQKDEARFNIAGETAFANGAAMMIRTNDIQKFGLMVDDYFLYYEEMDWCMRMRKSGFTIWYEPSAVIGHKESASVGLESPLQVYYHNRNRFIFAFNTVSSRLERTLSYFYQALIAIPKRTLSFIIQGKFRLLPPLWKGALSGIKFIFFHSYK